jgi:hypothetical protein
MVNAFSFCLYGPPNPRYYTPLVENIKIAQAHFPTWKVWIHFAPDVDAAYIRLLESYPNVVLRHTEKLGPINMIERFCTLDEPDVDLMVVRDADSLIHERDRWAIHQFLDRPQYDLHVIRDHPEHNIRIPGGLWALRKSAGICIRDDYAAYLRDPKDYGVAHDQNFINGYLYPKLAGRVYVTYSGEGNHFTGEAGDPFPFPWTETLFCGRVEFPPESPKFTPGKVAIRIPGIRRENTGTR